MRVQAPPNVAVQVTARAEPLYENEMEKLIYHLQRSVESLAAHDRRHSAAKG